ncbi:MAG: TIGR01620 family protein [Magnetococcales bacterium]|nr:TIGR01620 family protein [Magnetococcales bacterium]
MSAQVKWATPVELKIEPEKGAVSSEENKPVVSKISPFLLPGEIKEGDDIQQEPEAEPLTESESSEEALPWGEGWEREPKNRSFRWFLLLSLVFVLAIIIQDTLFFLQAQFARSQALGWGFGLLSMAVGGALLAVVVAEIKSYRAVQKISILQDQVKKINQRGVYGNGLAFTTKIMAGYRNRTELEPGFRQFQEVMDSNLDDREILALFSEHVFEQVDKKAYDIVVKNASVSALLTAISPMLWLDALLFLWRNIRMIRQIALCYGFRPGFVGTISLVKGVLQGVMLSATTSFLTEEATNSVGTSVASVLFAKAGQGMANGLLSARVGIQAMQLSRPIPFSAEQRPSLKRVRSEMVEQVKKQLL